MPTLRVLLLTFLVTLLPAQAALFECQGATPASPMPLPPIGSPDCEGLTTNAAMVSGIVRVEATPGCGMPAQGSGYLFMTGALIPVPVPIGAPLPRPLAGTEVEVRIPIPAGTNAVSFSWDLYDASGPLGLPPPLFLLDGIDISIVDAAGNGLVNLVFADSTTVSPAPGGCMPLLGLGVDTGVDGPELLATSLPPLPSGAYLSVALFQGASAAGIPGLGSAVVDNVLFTTGQVFSLNLSTPFGPGSLMIQNVAGTPFAPYVTLLTINQGNFPSGAIAGIDILSGELLFQLGYGAPPFVGTLDSGGGSSFAVGGGVLPSGLVFYGVTGELDSTGLFPVAVTGPTNITIL